MLEKICAYSGRSHPSSLALKKFGTQLSFQGDNVVTECRLSDAEAMRRGSEAASLDDADEVTQLPKIHSPQSHNVSL